MTNRTKSVKRKAQVCSAWLDPTGYSSQFSIEVESLRDVPAALAELPLASQPGRMVLVIWPDLERGDGNCVTVYAYETQVHRTYQAAKL